ncbi:TIGR03620 family F420-dependent LLM class oxidoreductase [Actinomycetes bacterium KLBMP 9759]
MNTAMGAIGPVGLWAAALDLNPQEQVADAAAEVEDLGFGALWISDGITRDPLHEAAALLRATRSLVVGTGVAIIWGRHPRMLDTAVRSVVERHPDRFVLGLGLGTSHAFLVEDVLGLRYERPLAAMDSFLDRLDAPDPLLGALGLGSAAHDRQPRLLAALGPKALAQARDRADGTITYLGTPEHTAQARAVLGPDRALVVEQAVVVGSGSAEAMGRAAAHVAAYLGARPYRESWRRLGFTDADFAGGGSAALVEALVALDEERAAARIEAHLAAGADHVCLQALPARPGGIPLDQWRSLSALVPARSR